MNPDRIPERRERDSLVQYRFDELKEDIHQLDEKKASKESVMNIIETVNMLRGEVHGLRRVLIVTALTWAIGTGTFLLAVLQLKGGGPP